MGLFEIIRNALNGMSGAQTDAPGGERNPEPPPPPRPQIKISKRPSMIRTNDGTPYYDVVCPYCMERYKVWELEFRSHSLTAPTDTVQEKGYLPGPDKENISFWENMHQMDKASEGKNRGFVLRVGDADNVKEVQFWDDDQWRPATPAQTAQKAIRGVRDKYGNSSYDRICPKCHNDLPAQIGLVPNYIVSMMGNTASGKTVYMNRLILSLLNNGLLPGRKIVVTLPLETKPIPIFKKSLDDLFYKEIKQEKQSKEREPALKKLTSISGGGLPAATPIQYMVPTLLDLQQGNEHVYLTLFDFPGEAIWKLREQDQSFFRNLMDRTNENANGWLFLLDSTTLDEVRGCILRNGDEALLAQTNLSNPLLNATPDQVIAQFSQFGNGAQIKSPVALVFSKSDIISRYADELQLSGMAVSADSPFLRDPSCVGRDKVDLNDLWKCSKALEEFLERNPVVGRADTFCPLHAWFAASATGAPVKNGNIEGLAAARRVMDPAEWLLWMFGAYPGSYLEGTPIWGGAQNYDGGG